MSLNNKAALSVRLITIDAERSGQRLDNFLMGTLKGVPRTFIYRIVRKGEIRVNKGRRSADYRLQVGDIVRIPPIRMAAPKPAAPELDWLNDCILFEDDHLLVLNKPSGMAVHGGSAVSFGVIEALRTLRPQARSLELVHRLDRGTSGCLIVAKRRSALHALHEVLRAGGFHKHYTALLCGSWTGGSRVVDAPLLKTKGEDRRVVVSINGKASTTVFTPEKRYADAVLVDIHLVTGRTHQARVHAVHIGFPIAGDETYAPSSRTHLWRARGLDRIFLHAANLVVPHPLTGAVLQFSAPLPPELTSLLEQLDGASV